MRKNSRSDDIIEVKDGFDAILNNIDSLKKRKKMTAFATQLKHVIKYADCKPELFQQIGKRLKFSDEYSSMLTHMFNPHKIFKVAKEYKLSYEDAKHIDTVFRRQMYSSAFQLAMQHTNYQLKLNNKIHYYYLIDLYNNQKVTSIKQMNETMLNNIPDFKKLYDDYIIVNYQKIQKKRYAKII